MDQASGTPEPRERAVSSEPSSTRPNPFDDDDISSRKRRRTSLSGSRSRSLETVRSMQDSSAAVDDPVRDSTMRIDADVNPTTPQTPDQQQSAVEQPTEPPSSRVTTINLRNSNTRPSSPSSPSSPTPHGEPRRTPEGAEDVKISVEEPEVDMVASAPIQLVDTPPSSSSEIGSPAVEVVAVQDDDDVAFAEPEVAIIGDDDVLSDPTPHFPYNDANNETYGETVARLTNYLSSQTALDEAVFINLQTWIDSWIRYGTAVGHDGTYESFRKERHLWLSLPDLIWALNSRKPAIVKPAYSRHATDFYLSFARLTAFFVVLDLRNLDAYSSPLNDSPRTPELVSPAYLTHLHTLTRRQEARQYEAQGLDAEQVWARSEEISELVDHFISQRGGSIPALTKLVTSQVALTPRYPKLVDTIAQPCHLVCDILRETCRRLHIHGAADPNSVGDAHRRLHLGHLFYNSTAPALLSAVDKHVSHLTSESALGQIQALTEIYQISLHGSHKMALEILREHRGNYSKLTLAQTREAVAWEWRFNMLGKLIMSSQMQLRVMAVTNMCSDLVGFWKRFQEGAEDKNSPFLSYFADYLLRTKLVEYILGPSCHPEITAESGNIVGFLLVTRFYEKEQTDLFWQTITTSQNPRVVDALIRMMSHIANLQDLETSLYFCEKFQGMSISSFTPAMRGLVDNIFANIVRRCQNDHVTPGYLPYGLCVRLLRESSVCGPKSQVAYPEVQGWAMVKFREVLQAGSDTEARREVYVSCIRDIAEKSSTTLGSIWALSVAIRNQMTNELHVLTTEHNLTTLLVDELEHAIETGRAAGVPAVLSGNSNSPRREFMFELLTHEADTVSSDLGRRLWEMLVGRTAACKEDRTCGWQIICGAAKRVGSGGALISTCFSDYLPTLPAEYFCEGSLEFIRDRILPRVNESNDLVLDEEASMAEGGIEQLWRVILEATDQQLANLAIETLVSGIYVDSKTILAYSPHRARHVHLGLVNRCLGQLDTAAKRLNAFSDGTASGDDEPMVIVATDSQVQEQERIFIRSLAVLRTFLQAHQTRAHFSVPDLRTLMLQSPNIVEGESAELKYQSFDGEKQTEVKPLNIGRRNTAASLLASLREATGFENYRIYYRGQAFLPNENEICKPLEDLHIHNGLILVKREEHSASPPLRIKPGASPLEIEILSHFKELWEYLSMDDKLAQEIYRFLINLPADDHVLDAFDSSSASYKDIFPPGQPYKSLYAIYATREYIIGARRLEDATPTSQAGDESSRPVATALRRALSFVVAALTDQEVIDRAGSKNVEMALLQNFVDCYLQLLRDIELHLGNANIEGVTLPLDRLVEILVMTLNADSQERCEVVTRTWAAILLSCFLNAEFWALFTQHPDIPQVIREVLLLDAHIGVRTQARGLIDERLLSDESHGASASDLAEFLWPIVFDLIAPASTMPSQCHEVFALAHDLLLKLVVRQPPVINVTSLALQCSSLLLKHRTTEEIGQLEPEDVVASGLVKILHCALEIKPNLASSGVFPDGFARQLFWRHLFPPQRMRRNDPVPKTILCTRTRQRLSEVLFNLVKRNESEFESMLHDLASLVPFDKDEDEEPYNYDLIPQFERIKSMRSPCGYVGLRNLSNTCYLNSLFTQLFMNTNFRQFILGAGISDAGGTQSLLFQTQKLFAFMQGSFMRFVDPTVVVQSIKTYEDTPIDVHNQMDVDEFYNLLFERFESQLLTPDERRVFRSFYGGQLVQQVSSKECEHISERLEPFFAIQCDIKGKSTLQESLQAYVDGEIMEGDNKYKCSTCDRHVDAVKRTCLKDIPDNLIFHLKRFDFNLRTLQRSKINDYFTFPTRIDMRPYTIDHLTQPVDEAKDMFELVGVLVHSGTAESGHYYSYIRERPSNGDDETWVEFNDDIVTAWDPAQMESSTFGGPDFRPPFENNGIVYDRTYSAYMLFYQRSTALRSEQAAVIKRGYPTPLHVSVPPELAEHIKSENTMFLRRHCLYDPTHISFIKEMFCHARKFQGGECSDDHALENLAMEMSLGHLDQVVSRTKDVPEFAGFVKEMLMSRCRDCARCAFAFYQYFNERPESFRQLVQRNPEPTVRLEVGALLIKALELIKDTLPRAYGVPGPNDTDVRHWSSVDPPVVKGVLRIFNCMWANFHLNLRSWHECFKVMTAFAALGKLESAVLLDDDYLLNTLRIISADTAMDLSTQYARMIHNVVRRMATRPPIYDSILQLISTLMDSLQPTIDSAYIVDHPGYRLSNWLRNRRNLPWTSGEVQLIHQEWNRNAPGSIFVEKLIIIDQDRDATDSILEKLIAANKMIDAKVFYTLRQNIQGQVTQHTVAPFLRAAAVYCQSSQSTDLVFKLVQHISNQCKNLQSNDGPAFFDFLKEMLQPILPGMGESTTEFYLHGLANVPRWAPGLLAYYDVALRSEVEEFLKDRIFRFGPKPEFDDAEGGETRATTMVNAARQLGVSCLVYLRDNYVQRRVQVAKESVAALQRVNAQCSKYFAAEGEEDHSQVDAEYVELCRAVLEPLRRMVVDELDEEGSDWEGSDCASSEHMGSLADLSMQAVSDLNDADLQ